MTKDFFAYYNNLPSNIKILSEDQFKKLSFRYQLGFYLEYFSTKDYFIAANALGWRIRKYNSFEEIKKVFYDGETKDLLVVYREAVIETFKLIENPF